MNGTTRSIWQNGIRSAGRLLGAGLLMAAVVAPAFGANSAATRWSKGDTWEVQLEQQQMQGMSPSAPWIPSFKLQFEVTERSSKELRVEVRTIPENRFEQHLVLRYNLKGELLTAQVVDAERVISLRRGGACGVFGMLGRECFDMLKAPAGERAGGASTASVGVRALMDAKGDRVQTWRAGEGHWRRFESRDGIPQRATLLRGAWKKLKPIN
jgi:hypothetical protein